MGSLTRLTLVFEYPDVQRIPLKQSRRLVTSVSCVHFTRGSLWGTAAPNRRKEALSRIARPSFQSSLQTSVQSIHFSPWQPLSFFHMDFFYHPKKYKDLDFLSLASKNMDREMGK